MSFKLKPIIQGVFKKTPFFINLLRYSSEELQSLILPLKCPICNISLQSNNLWPLCKDCMTQIEYVCDLLCEKCQQPISQGNLCPRCLSGFDAGISFPIRSLAWHRGVSRELVLLCKFKGHEYLARQLGQPLKQLALPFLQQGQRWYVVPVPLYKDKLLKRGFNLPDQMSLRLSRSINARYRPFWLTRDVDTQTQVGKSFEQRLANMENAFSCPCPLKIAEKNIFLIDDVTTTGATLAAAAKPLLKAKANVVALTLNRG